MTTVGTKNYSGEIRNDRVCEDNCVTMYVRDGVVTDYEYCYEIPAEIQTFMIRKGYDLTEVLV